MRKTEARIKMLLNILIENNKYLTMQDISYSMGVSTRSVQNYLLSIEKWFEEQDIKNTEILKKQGKGICIRTTNEDRIHIQNLLRNPHESIEHDNRVRQLNILYDLLISNIEITIQTLMDKYYISRQIVINDLDWISEWLSQYKIELYKMRRRGIVLYGDEADIRNAISGLFELYDQNGKLPDMPSWETKLSELYEAYSGTIVTNVIQVIKNAEAKYDFVLPQRFIKKIVTHMVIAVHRIINGEMISEEFLPVNEEYPKYEQESAEWIAGELERIFDIEVNDYEKAYICMHLIGYDVFAKKPYSRMALTANVEQLTSKLLDCVDKELNTDFSKIENLFWQLNRHFRTSLYRLKVDKNADGTHKQKVPDECISLYRVIKKIVPKLFDEYGVKPDEEEILEITWKFFMAMRKNTKPVMALLVTNLDVCQRFNVLNKIENREKWIMVIGSCKLQNFKSQMLHEYEIIFATEHLPVDSSRYIYIDESENHNLDDEVSRLLKKNEMENYLLNTTRKKQ